MAKIAAACPTIGCGGKNTLTQSEIHIPFSA